MTNRERLNKAERDELARKLEGAKAEGRREAFREAFREAGVVPLACAEGFIAWLRKAAGR